MEGHELPWVKFEGSDASQVGFELENPENEQVLIVQHSDTGQMWIRFREPNSGYPCDTFEELEGIVYKFLGKQIEVAIAYSDEGWEETTIVASEKYDKLKPEWKWMIASWEKLNHQV